MKMKTTIPTLLGLLLVLLGIASAATLSSKPKWLASEPSTDETEKQENREGASPELPSVDTIPAPKQLKSWPAPPPPFQKIQVNFKQEGQYTDKISFWRAEGDSLPIKVVSLDSLHPFNDLPLKKSGPRMYGSDDYDLRGVSREELEKYFGRWEVPDSIADKVPVAANGQLQCFGSEAAKEYTVVTYEVFISNSRAEVIAMVAEYVVFNNKGEITGRFRNNKAGLAAIVTQDGRYVAAKYGGLYGPCGGNYLQEGLLVMDSQNGHIVADYPLENGGSYHCTVAEDYLVLIDNGQRTPIYYYIIKPKGQRIYKSSFTLKRHPSIGMGDFKSEYLVYYLDDARTKPAKAYFEKDFEIIPLNR